MSERTLLIEHVITCNTTTCGSCGWKGLSNQTAVCNMFTVLEFPPRLSSTSGRWLPRPLTATKAGNDTMRCPQCLQAEVTSITRRTKDGDIQA